MYTEWVSLQTSIQSDSRHVSVLKRFPAAVGKDIVIPVVKTISQGLSINSNDQPSKLSSTEEVKWTMEVICYGLTLPFSEHDIVNQCVNIYCEWLSGCLIRKKLCVPKPILESPVSYSIAMFSHLYNLFVPREKSTIDQVCKQALLCHRALKMLENIAKESQALTRELWESMLKFLLAITDTLLAPPKEKVNDGGISDELAERVISVLFEMWLTACSASFPVPSLWRTFRDMCSNWRHHEAVIIQWNRVNYALTAPLLVKLYGPDHPELVIGVQDKSIVAALTRDCISKLTDDCLVQCWFRFLHILSNPVDLCRVESISETPKFLHHALTSEKVIEPNQHECLQQLPVIFHRAMKGVANIMDAFLGAHQPEKEDDVHPIIPFTRPTAPANPGGHTPPLSKSARSSSVVLSNPTNKVASPSKHSASSLTPLSGNASTSTLSSPGVSGPVTGGLLHYKSRPSLSPDRSSINSILNVLGAWMFEAALSSNTNKRRRPASGVSMHRRGSVSQRAGSMSSPGASHGQAFDLNFDAGRAEACGAIARLMCSKRTGEVIQPVFIARCFMTIYDSLTLLYPVKGDVVTFTLFHMADMLRVDLPGVNILLPRILPALEAVLTSSTYNFTIHEQLPEVELRKACIHLLLSTICLPLHYNKMDIKDLYTGDVMFNYLSLRSRIAKLILNSLMIEKDTANTNMLLGGLSLFIQDMATYEYREQDKLSSDTSNISVDQYNLAVGGASDSASQSADSDQQDTPPEVILRKPSKKGKEDFNTAAGVLGIAARQIAATLISDWWTDYPLAVGALEVLTSLAKTKLQIVSSQMCKETVSQICKLIAHLCSRPPKNQTRDLHSMIVTAFHCLSQWILEHSYLLQDKQCLYTVLEVVELGISGKRSHQPGSTTVLMKADKEHLPMSLRVKDAAEALLMCITDQVDSFPSPCGSESLYSTLSERDLTDDVSLFKYFALNNQTIVGVLDGQSPQDGDEASSQVIKVVIRGPFGRQVWIMEPKSQPAGTVRPGNVKRPAPAEYKAPKPRIAQRWWPSSVDSIPLVKADKTLPGLDDLDDLDPALAAIINETIELEIKNGPRLASPKPAPPAECVPPKPSGVMQSARVLLSQLGLLNSHSLKPAPQHQDMQGMPAYLSRLDSTDGGFVEALQKLDKISNRSRDTVFIFYVKSGQTKVSDILENTKGYKSLNCDYKDLLLSLGWPVNVSTHPGWTGMSSTSSATAQSRSYQTNEPDQIPASLGPAAFDGTKWLLYWGDSRSEMAFIIPTEERIAMISHQQQGAPRSRRGSVDTANDVNAQDLSPIKKPKGFGKGIKKIINKISSEEKRLLNQTLLKHRHRQQQMAKDGDAKRNIAEKDLRRCILAVIEQQHAARQTSVASDSSGVMFTAPNSSQDDTVSEKSMSSTTGTLKSNRLSGQEIAGVRMILVWCERVEDKETVPWEGLLNSTNGPSDSGSPAEYMIVYITSLQNGLLRVHITSHTERCGAVLPLVDGMICSKRTLGAMVRLTAINMAARKRLLSELSMIPHNKRVQKTQEIINRHRIDCSEWEFYEELFTS